MINWIETKSQKIIICHARPEENDGNTFYISRKDAANHDAGFELTFNIKDIKGVVLGHDVQKLKTFAEILNKLYL